MTLSESWNLLLESILLLLYLFRQNPSAVYGVRKRTSNKPITSTVEFGLFTAKPFTLKNINCLSIAVKPYSSLLLHIDPLTVNKQQVIIE